MNSIGDNYFQIIVACLIAAALFIVFISYVSMHPKKNTKLLRIFFVVMFIFGMITYCYCNYRVLEEVTNGNLKVKSLEWVNSENVSNIQYVCYVVMRSVVDVGMMFYGRGNSEAFYNLPESKNPSIVLIFWLLHMIAFFTTSSALLIRFGDDFLRWIRIRKIKGSDVDLIFGINEDSITFGRNISDKKGSMLVYVDSIVSDKYETSINNLGGVIYSGKDALKAEISFLSDIRIEKDRTKLRLYILSKEYDRNLQYARMMTESLKKLQIQPEQTTLVLLGTDEWKGMIFQASENKYGYGKVLAFDEYEMNARLLIQEYPLCNAIKFDRNGRAIEDMNVLIVGFGRIGHEVLRKIIANGQFEGSNFKVTIYDPKFQNRTGFFSSQYPKMFANYYIDFEPQDGRGNKIFQFIQENASKLKYIVICLEDREISRNIAIRLVDRLQTMGYSQDVYTCDSKSVRCYSQDVQKCETHWIYDSELLYSEKFDRYAMELNHYYCNNEKTLEENWKECNYFNRMSSRASVDYLIPLIKKINGTKENLTPEQKENLARSEHLRWCAFLYTFGYDVLNKKELVERCKTQQAEINKFGKSKIKPTQDRDKMKHACLVSWEELKYISMIENFFTHGNKNYQNLDERNIEVVMELMQSDE